METETVIEDRDPTTGRMRNLVEVGVEDGEDLMDLYAEDANGDSVTLHLAVGEIDDLIAALQRAKTAALANR